MSYAGLRTKNGYAQGEVISAMQKCIRRGLEQEALLFAAEAATVNGVQVWNRLAVIASEDIGMASPFMPVLIDTLRESYFDALRRDNGSATLFLGHAILALCRADKSNLVNVFVGATLIEQENRPIPDVALDGHTARGRKLGRGWDFFFTESTKLHPHVPQEDEEKYKQIFWDWAKAHPDGWTDRVTIEDLKRGAGRSLSDAKK